MTSKVRYCSWFICYHIGVTRYLIGVDEAGRAPLAGPVASVNLCELHFFSCPKWYAIGMASYKNVSASKVPHGLKPHSKIPDSWIKAFGILKGRKPDPVKELKKMRQEWDQYSMKLQKRMRHGAR